MALPKTDEQAIRAIIRAARKGGWELRFVRDGEEQVPTFTEREAIEAITAVDEASLHLRLVDQRAWIYFVLGNEPYEVAADYTTNLVEVDDLLDKWISEE